MISHLNKAVIILLVSVSTTVFAQTDSTVTIENIGASAGCLKCVFHTSHKCALGVKIDDKIYRVEGSSLKEHGKPRAKHGLCKEERDVNITGKVELDKFFAYDFKLVPLKADQLPKIEIEDPEK